MPPGPSLSRGAPSAPRRWRRGRAGGACLGAGAGGVGSGIRPLPASSGRWAREAPEMRLERWEGVPSRRAWEWGSRALALRDAGSRRHSPAEPTVLEASTYSRPARSHPLPTLKEFKARRPSPLEPPANSLEGGGRAGVVLGMCGLFQETTRAQDPVLAPPTTLANFPCPSRLSSPPQVRGHVSCVAQSPGPEPRSFRERGPRTFQWVIFSKEYDQRHSSATLWRSRLR